MHFASIKNCDIANGEGVRVSLFVSGCTHKCEGCFNPEAWDFNYGNEFTEKEIDKIIEMLAPDYISGLTLLGGEPFEPRNQERLLPFVKRVRETYPNKSIWAFSGFTYEELCDTSSYANCEYTGELLSLIDVLVDGRYVEKLRNISLRFRGSENQRLINIPETMREGKIVLWDE